MQVKKKLFHVEYLGIMRDVVKVFLENNDEIVLTHHQPDCEGLMQLLKEHEIDVLILGNSDPNCESFNYPELCRKIRLLFPHIKIIVNSVFATISSISQTMNAGAHGFITNEMGSEDLIAAINAVKKDERYISKPISSFFHNTFEFLAGFTDSLKPKTSVFTKRELEILNLIAKGQTNNQIADSLHISTKTVETHRRNLVAKAKVKNTAELIAYSSSSGFLVF